METIWSSLTINTAISAVELHLGERLTNLCIPRNSYINRVYEMERAETSERIIVKFYRPNRWTRSMILNEHELLHKLFDSELPVIPPLSVAGETLFDCEDIHFAIFPKQGGRSIDEMTEALWQEIGRLLGRLHNISATIKNPDRMHCRPNIATAEHLNTILSSNVLPANYVQPFTTTCQAFIRASDPAFDNCETLLLHGDCHFGNIIYRPDDGLYIVDFDDSVQGPVIQDLWMLLPDLPERSKLEVDAFLSGYTTFRDFSVRSLELVPALKLMRQVHFAAWCAIQKNEPQFEAHFPDWGSIQYWNELIRDLQSY